MQDSYENPEEEESEPDPQEQDFFSGRKEVEVRAWFFGQRLDLKAIEKTRRISTSPYVIRAGHDGYAVLFRYGVVVLFGMGAIEETSFINDIKSFIADPFKNPEMESLKVVIDSEKSETIEPEHIRLKNWDIERIQLIAEILARCAVLSYYETRIAQTFDMIEPIAAEMQSGKLNDRRRRDLLKHIGTTLSIQRKMVGHVEIDDKPDILWDLPDLERLFGRICDEYELKERYIALKHKLELIHRTAETMHGLLQERKTLHVEWYIVILILVEIILMLIDAFIGI
jgi:uncharacterized Rmd1/YagE family protein